MAKPGAPHETMVQALTLRLKQLYPEPETKYSLGGVVGRIGLKPDIYMLHADGHKWAFEMVHGNQLAQHLLENHKLYVNADIHDTWILWDELRPKAGPDHPFEQGIFLEMLEGPKVYQLTGPQQAILSMQTGNTRYIFSFTAQSLPSQLLTSELTSSLQVGLDIYRFEGWDGEELFAATYDFVSTVELIFTPDGRPLPPKQDEVAMQLAIQKLGLELSKTVMPVDALQHFEKILGSAAGWQTLATAALVSKLIALPPEEQQEIISFIQSGNLTKLQAFQSHLSDVDVSQAINNHEIMSQIAEESDRFRGFLMSADIPEPFKRLLLELMKDNSMTNIAEFMKWVAESDVLRQARNSGQRS
jgi:hypothetical protein